MTNAKLGRSLLIGVLSATTGAGCDVWNAPKRVTELEARVDDLSAAVSALSGKPVGGPTKHEAHEGAPSEAATAKAHDGPGAEGSNGGDANAPPMDKPKDEHAQAEPPAADKADKADKDEHGKVAEPAPPAKPAHVAHFGYEGPDGPKAWGALEPEWSACGTGKAQSPIDISPRAGAASPITFHYKPTAGTIVDNGHTLQVNLAAGSSIVIDDHTYDLVQFHVHTPSEHLVAGEQYPLEVHLVHKDKEGKLAVIGVLYDVGPETKALGQLWAKWPTKPDAEQKLRKPFDPSSLLPETRTVYRYAGSLTTPPCSEGVMWNVMRRTMTETRADLTVVGLRMKPNARPVQMLGERKIQ